MGRDFRSQLRALDANEYSEVAVSSALYKAFACPEPCVTPTAPCYEKRLDSNQFDPRHPTDTAATHPVLGRPGLGRPEALPGRAHQPSWAEPNASSGPETR